MKKHIFVGDSRLVEIVVTKFHSFIDMNCLGVSCNNQLEMIFFKGNAYFLPILPVEIPGIAGAGFLVNDVLTTEGYEGCMIVATWTIKIFPCINSRF